MVYAVGDVHGRLDLLRPLLDDIARDALDIRPSEPPLLVMLGDYVDRGQDSRGVVDLILQWDSGMEICALKGNHEEALLKFLDDPNFGQVWLEHGAAATLLSYGVRPPTVRTDPAAWVAARDALVDAVSAKHLRFYQTLELMRIEGDYAFVHAGVRPSVPLANQLEHDLLWIRQEFLQARGPFEKTIVHGHTPMEAPQLTQHRVGIDTGAYATGVLTAIRLFGKDQLVMQVGGREPSMQAC